MTEEKVDELRELLLDGAKSIFNKGLVENNEGNISLRVGKKEEYLITPTANQYDKLTKEELVHMSFDGIALSSGKLPSSEVKLHVALYKSRPKVQCVIHTHSTFASMLSVVRKNIPIIMEEQVVYLGGSIDISSYGEAHTEDIGEVAIKALGYKNAALLANHGVIICGKSVNNAIKNAELVEKLAKVYWGALLVGKPYTLEEQNLEKFYLIFKQLFANCPRKLLN
ncbi:MAG: class II aldolase/adducin family protein [Candidatus Thorarchaeota archaeon]